MKRITQRSKKEQISEEKKKAKKKEKIVKYAIKNGKSKASDKYKEPLSNIKRWFKKYNGDWVSLLNKSRRPHSHPRQHTLFEETEIIEAWEENGKKGIDYTYSILIKKGYTRSYSGFFHALRRLELIQQPKGKSRRTYRQCTATEIPGEKIQIDVKEVPYYCIGGKHKANGKKMYQWTAIDECTRWRFLYAFEEHTPENSVKFLEMLMKKFVFEIMTVQTDNGTEFTYKFLNTEKKCPFEEALEAKGITHKLIKPRTPWHNGKVERSHRMDQRYFYEYEKFGSIEELNAKLKEHMKWSNEKPMRIFNRKSPKEKLQEYIWVI